MALLPERRQLQPIQARKRNVPVDQIIAIRGQSPIATGIETAGNVIGQVLAKKAELRRQGQQLAQLEQLAGQPAGTFSGLDTNTATSLASGVFKDNLNRKATVDRIRLLEKEGGFAPGSLGDDYDAAKTVFTQAAIGKRQKENPYLVLSERRADTAEGNAFKTRLNNQKNRLVNDPRIKPLYAQDIGLRQVGEISDLVQKGNTVAAGALGTKMARAMGEVGALTDNDVSRYVVSGRLDRMAADKLSKMMRGLPSNATQAEIAQISSVLRDSFAEKIQPIYNEYIQSFSEVEGLTPDEVSKKMSIPYTPPRLLPPPGAVGQESPAQRKARLLQELNGAPQ